MRSTARASMMAAFAGVVVALFTGCYSEASIRARAASEMGCPADQLWVEPGIGPTRKVHGCNRTHDMVCSNTLRAPKSAFNGIAETRVGGMPGSSGCVSQTVSP